MIETIEKLLDRYRTFVLYCIIGCTGATLDFLLFAALTRWIAMHYLAANFLSVSAGIVNNFFLNYFFNFKSGNRLLLRLLSFYAVGLTGLALSCYLLYLFIDEWHWHMLLSKFLTIFFVTVTQYLLNKTVSFRREKHD